MSANSAQPQNAAATGVAATPGSSKGAVQTGPDGKPLPDNGGLKRTLNTFDLVIFGMIFMVPIAPFSILASVNNTSHGMPALAYLIAMVAMLFTALSFGQMVPLFPSSGSIYVYASHEMNTPIGFAVGWLMILQYLVTPAVMLIMAGEAIHEYVPHVPVWVWCLIFLAFITVVALRGMGATVLIDKIALVCELIVLALFIGFGIAYVIRNPQVAHFSGDAFYDPKTFNLNAMMSAVSLCALSYVGFGSIVTLDDEVKKPRKAPPKAMLIIVLALGVLYMLMSWVTVCMDPSGNVMAGNPNNGFYQVAALAGNWLGILCAVANALALGLFTSLSGLTAISRLLFTMACDGALPARLKKVSKKTSVPIAATVFCVLVSLVLLFAILPLGMDTGAKISNFGALGSYCMLNLAVLWGLGIKGRGTLTGAKKIWFNYVFPIIGAIITLIIFISLGALVWIIGVIWLVIGIAFYFVWTKKLHHSVDLRA
ncbi:APC family permease [Bifidobacterium gallicum]|uniref:Amino acid permease n=1 Tax=Bifidobacterium gallicum DSM 20093 = LMG 11596 TaxID=561180 RepID=D1NTJ2_9BIFI|nr:APC family permease [Bifidobacterium gallicum]EFA23046.1 amino acid permease [Bifidobacterium gallicum DSM 20093 = LMG 11596]KFI57649.1 amino acid transporter [Bifidobacterium gallicum DSM 20093 = LMG 11596]